MTKKIFEKLYQGGVLSNDDITPDEKKALNAYMQGLGMSPTTTYLRFFKKGFDPWEIDGITKCKEKFLLTASPGESPDTSDGNRGYGYVLSLGEEEKNGSFYELCKDLTLCTKFHDYMRQSGMSIMTTVRRFKNENWKPWELRGIRQIIADMP